MNRPPAAPTPADQQRLALLIEAEAIQLGEFVALLEREEALLTAGDTDALLALTQDKNERYRRLQRLSDDRALLLGRLGRVTSDTTLRELLAAADQPPLYDAEGHTRAVGGGRMLGSA